MPAYFKWHHCPKTVCSLSGQPKQMWRVGMASSWQINRKQANNHSHSQRLGWRGTVSIKGRHRKQLVWQAPPFCLITQITPLTNAVVKSDRFSSGLPARNSAFLGRLFFINVMKLSSAHFSFYRHVQLFMCSYCKGFQSIYKHKYLVHKCNSKLWH